MVWNTFLPFCTFPSHIFMGQPVNTSTLYTYRGCSKICCSVISVIYHEHIFISFVQYHSLFFCFVKDSKETLEGTRKKVPKISTTSPASIPAVAVKVFNEKLTSERDRVSNRYIFIIVPPQTFTLLLVNNSIKIFILRALPKNFNNVLVTVVLLFLLLVWLNANAGDLKHKCTVVTVGLYD